MSFDEWYEENSWDLENYYDAEKSFKAGQQSRQAEIDDLIDMVKTSADSEMYLFDELQRVNKDRDELQKRIDNLTNTNESLVAYKNQLLDDIEGNKND